MTTTPDPVPTEKATKKTEKVEADGRVPAFVKPRQWAPWLLGVLLVLVLGEVAARVIESTDPPQVTWYDAATQQRVPMMDDRTADVAFVGTSMAWQGFVPGPFSEADGRSAFNAGLAGAVPVVMEPWILNEAEPRLQPDLVVWGLSSFDLAPNYGDTQLEAYRSAPETRTGALAWMDRNARRFSALIRMRTIMRQPSKLIGVGADETQDDIDEAVRITGVDGERLDFDEDKGDRRGQIVKARLKDFDPDPADLDAVRRTATELRERGVRLVLVQMPVPEIFVERHPNGRADYDKTGVAIRELGAELNADVVDFDGLFADDSFVDYTHLDEPSTQQFTEWFVAALAALESSSDGCSELALPGAPAPAEICANR